MKKTLGESVIFRVYGKRDARIVRMWAQDPRCTQDRCHDPIQNLHALLEMMDEIGRGDVARKVIDHLQTAMDAEKLAREILEIVAGALARKRDSQRAPARRVKR